MVGLSEEASDYFAGKRVMVERAPTPQAIRRWNQAQGQVIGVFHVAC